MKNCGKKSICDYRTESCKFFHMCIIYLSLYTYGMLSQLLAPTELRIYKQNRKRRIDNGSATFALPPSPKQLRHFCMWCSGSSSASWRLEVAAGSILPGQHR